MWQEELAEILHEDFALRKEKNGRYSLRAYAKFLDISPATLASVMGGSSHWNLKKERVAQVLSKTSIASHKKKKLLIKMGLPVDIQRKSAEPKEYAILTDWRHRALLLGHSLPPRLRRMDRLQERFGLSTDEANKITQTLISRNLLKPSPVNPDILEASPQNWIVEEGPPPEVIREHHRESLKLAVRSIEEIQPQERDLSSITFCGTVKNIDEIRKEIRSFHDRIMNLMNHSDKNDDVVHLSISLFPIRFSSQEEQG